MRRNVIAFMGTLSGLVLLFTYRTSTNSGAPPTTGPGSSGGTTSGGTTPSGSTSGGTTAGGTASGTYTGDAVDTRWGPVQVRITVQNGRITAAEAVRYPQENSRDQEINAYAVPQLNQEVVQQQSAGIDAVSGATVTSDGYLRSLQSAVDQAHL